MTLMRFTIRCEPRSMDFREDDEKDSPGSESSRRLFIKDVKRLNRHDRVPRRPFPGKKWKAP